MPQVIVPVSRRVTGNITCDMPLVGGMPSGVCCGVWQTSWAKHAIARSASPLPCQTSQHPPPSTRPPRTAPPPYADRLRHSSSCSSPTPTRTDVPHMRHPIQRCCQSRPCVGVREFPRGIVSHRARPPAPRPRLVSQHFRLTQFTRGLTHNPCTSQFMYVRTYVHVCIRIHSATYSATCA